ncbi:MAG: class IV adenylate cyclase [Thermoplasmata archaeon]
MIVLEVESKFRSPGNEKVEKTLIRLGARKISEGAMEDVYFSHPSRDFSKTDETLRLRKTNSASELTYKGPRMKLESAKAREEITLRTENPLAVQRIIESLGFIEFLAIRKRRTSYMLDKLRVDVDDVNGLGEFVELEAMTELPERSTRLIELARRELELDKLEPRTYLELMIEKIDGSKNKL